MANNTKSDPRGIDIQIDRLQKAVYKDLSAMLKNGKTLEGYGRVYANKRKDATVFEVYTGKNEYKDIAILDGSSFFFLRKWKL